ncbi:endonuclease MutS2 [Aliibacillus thermotolerans]|uniref:Endonuclease MutS2 n=1 Tax=Aliibacillus thermotolerans TaxID=1834418 RepID=A0ABW0UA22_9BACI|nr:endonuclease MutS2 [Aliibacillus thermotolerans]MDA3130482.1 endonuclease MutS2 [Aliibacillus thermotolerans]
MNERVMRVLEYDKMKEQLKEHVTSSLGRKKVEALMPHSSFTEVKKDLARTKEGVKVLGLRGNVPLGGIHDIHAHIQRARIGGTLHSSELLEVADTIRAGRRMKVFVHDMVEEEIDVPELEQIVAGIFPLTELERKIKGAIDDHGEVMDIASPALRQIRRQIRKSEAAVRSKLENYLRSPDQQKKLSDTIITIRNDRYVLPVKQEYRSSFGGIVHDQSSSGATLFIEPQAVVTLNNELREGKMKERQEIERILKELSSEVQKHTEELLQNLTYVTELDFLFAKARYAKALKATEPILNEEGRFVFKKARHPLIDQEEVVPIDVELGTTFSSLIITGPNTGGKTVTLKTVGLLTLMVQSGLFLPVDEGSEATVFTKVFADIGDEQSIEQNLSTFSSHMTNIVNILQEVNHESLVLFDEIGAGTDPTEGAALAVAILDDVYKRGAKLVATTHYSELKGYAYNREGVMNASVEFDVDTLRPTYRLLIGVPGSSNAFLISRRLGLAEDIIERAEKELHTDTRQVEKMISSLEKERRQVEAEWEEATRLREEAETLYRDLEQRIRELEREKELILERTREKAEDDWKKAQKEAERIIEELRTLQKESAHIKEHRLIDAKKKLQEAEPKTSKRREQIKRKAKKERTFSPGEEVRVARFGQTGTVLEKLDEKEYLVQLGIMKVNVTADEMEKVKEEKTKQPMRPVTSVSTHNTVKPELDLRGFRYEDAMREVEKYLDEALLAGYPRVHIIHGKGTGALRKGVKELLKNHPNVKSTRDGGMGEGGLGNTVVELK